jgi:hypothetical protein
VHAWKKAGGRAAELVQHASVDFSDLYQLADATQRLYLNLPSLYDYVWRGPGSGKAAVVAADQEASGPVGRIWLCNVIGGSTVDQPNSHRKTRSAFDHVWCASVGGAQHSHMAHSHIEFLFRI